MIGSAIRISFVFGIISSLSCSESDVAPNVPQPVEAKHDAENAPPMKRSFENGVVFINGLPRFLDFGYNTQLLLPYELRMKKKDKPLPNGEIIWRGNEIDLITIHNGRFDESERENNKKQLYYSVRNNEAFVSDDKNTWDHLKIRIINRKHRRSVPPEMYMVVMRIYLECKWFSGEYELIDDLPHVHPKE